ncbi:MAG: mechanosensitive ion channel family protein [Sulfurimicrobium sp.]|nr:mechanosensitive ion channel family protein [Sulfurimicrobium sp.]MDP1703786.1 mechanosensitive ion channel family protein [Sulfurimicrobium sp.]MDP2198485.1 mechanosensitive ion channel family protein [Sulfurimicrobium sp.]MDP3687993.1 mechanosensitive ion channel family protein [Sulfurimicrobium sp.]
MEKFAAGIDLVNMKELLQLSQSALHILLILVLAWMLLRLSGKGIRMLKEYLRSNADNNLEDLKRIETLSRVFRYIASVVISVVAGMVVLSELGISIAPILATAGVLGIAVGFGAQSLIKDYFNGFFMLLENQVRQGDVVEAGGKGGLVEEVTLRYIKMRDYDGHVHFIPNGIITTVTNMSRGFAFAVIDVGVAYREDTDQVMEVMRQVGNGMREDEVFGEKIVEPMEMAGVDRWDDSAVILRCRFKVQPLEQWGVRREYLRRLKQAFDREGIEIPYPHLTVYPGQARDGTAPPLHVVQSGGAS